MKRAAKKDKNHKQIVDKLEALGYCVIDASQLKNAFDIVLVTAKGNFIIEIKNPNSLKKNYTQLDIEAKLSEGERRCKGRVEKAGGVYYTVATLEQILEIIGHED